MKKLKTGLVLGLGGMLIGLGLWLACRGVLRYGYRGALALAAVELGIFLPFILRWLRARLNPAGEMERRLAGLVKRGENLHIARYDEGDDEAGPVLSFRARVVGQEGVRRICLKGVEPREALGEAMLCLGLEVVGFAAGVGNFLGRLEQTKEEPGELALAVERFRLEEQQRWREPGSRGGKEGAKWE